MRFLLGFCYYDEDVKRKFNTNKFDMRRDADLAGRIESYYKLYFENKGRVSVGVLYYTFHEYVTSRHSWFIFTVTTRISYVHKSEIIILEKVGKTRCI